jgi:drug/metabolite transporter (DMT)-like permease
VELTASLNTAGTAERVRDWAYLLVCNLIWASQFAMVKLVQTQTGFVFATFFPMTLATLILLPLVLHERRKRSAEMRTQRLTLRDIGHFAALGVLGQVAAQLCVTWGTGLSTAASAALLSLSLPILTTIMAFFLLGERLTLVRLIAFALALLGVLQTSGIDMAGVHFEGAHNLLGNLLIFVSVAGSAFYNVYSKRLLHRFTPLELLFYSYIAAITCMFPIAVVVEPQGFVDLPHYRLSVWVGLLLLAVFQYALSMIIFLRVLRRVDATQAAVMNYLIPFFGVLIGWAILKEPLTGAMIFGGVLGVGSTLFATVWDKPPKSQENQPHAF